MWLARYFPGLSGLLGGVSLDTLTPEECKTLAEAGRDLLKAESDERFAHTKVIAQAGGLKLG